MAVEAAAGPSGTTTAPPPNGRSDQTHREKQGKQERFRGPATTVTETGDNTAMGATTPEDATEPKSALVQAKEALSLASIGTTPVGAASGASAPAGEGDGGAHAVTTFPRPSPVPTSSGPLPSLAPKAPTLPPGTGNIHLSGPPRSPRAHFTANHASYPLKLLAPRPLPSQPANVALLYTLAYGGGLVSGDCVQLSCTIDAGQALVMRTQGSTKVYKHRAGLRPAAHGISPALAAAVKRGEEAPAVRQRMHVALGAGATFVLLPDALSPFRGSRYVQAQRVALPADGSGSVLLLDWVNSGRGDRPLGRPELRPWAERFPNGGAKVRPSRWTEAAEAQSDWGKAEEEYWAMGYYASTNELVVGDRILARERMVLDNAGHTGDALSPAARRLAPYHVYATVLVYGPQFASLRAHLDTLVDATSQFQVPQPPGLLWSYSPLSDVCGIIRLAGLEVEDVRDWMRGAFEEGGVAELVGPGLWPRCI